MSQESNTFTRAGRAGPAQQHANKKENNNLSFLHESKMPAKPAAAAKKEKVVKAPWVPESVIKKRAKQEEIAGFFTNTSEEFMGSHSITDSHISTITDTILLLQYVEIRGEMARALNVFKMRGSWHDKGIREFVITGNGPEIKDSFSNFERIISGVPHRITTDERADLARIVRSVESEN